MSDEPCSIGLGKIISDTRPKEVEGLIVVFGERLVGVKLDGIKTGDPIFSHFVQLKLSALKSPGDLDNKIDVPPVALQFLFQDSSIRVLIR